MPELPEVETTKRGISPHVTHREVSKIIVRDPRLRWPVDKKRLQQFKHQIIDDVQRRGKYLLFHCARGTLICHLGMSGTLRLVSLGTPPEKHDHIDIELADEQCLRFNDPRRFGAMIWTTADPLQHKLLKHLGPEPLSRAFTADYLLQRAAGRQCAIKTLIMDSQCVVGVGNIYAQEALFSAGIHPQTPAGSVDKQHCQALVKEIKQVLRRAIRAGGTTLKDFHNPKGKPGYFRIQLRVYGRAGQACQQCDSLLQMMTIGQRSTVYCEVCQPRDKFAGKKHPAAKPRDKRIKNN